MSISSCFRTPTRPAVLAAAWLCANLAPGRVLAAGDGQLPVYLRPEALAAEEALLAVRYGATADVVYGTFNTFVKNVFGAEAEPLVYERFGDTLTLLEDGFWRYVSERSAAIGWESNLPATSFVEFGPTPALGRRTGATDRHYFLHIHHLTGLEPGQTVHYRFVGIDERGNRLEGPMQTFETLPAGTLMLIGQDHVDGPIVIDAPGRYLLARDITSTTGGIEINSPNVTLDLGGHTITYATAKVADDFFTDKWASYDRTGPVGIRNWLQSDFTLLNGTILQGTTAPFENTGNDDTCGFNPVYIRGAANVEVAGIVVDYQSRQNTGIMNRGAKDNHRFHHNVIRDRGAIVRNRHGAGSRAIHFFGGEGRNHVVHHNLVARSRQNGLNLVTPGGRLHSNEVYIDSWSTNSFAMGVPDGEDENDETGHYNNRIFATGFNPYGFGWASKHLRIHDNFIYMHGLDTTHRWHEKWGDINLLAALRVTNYGKGDQKRLDLQYRNNLVIMRAKQGANVQGTRFFSAETIEGIVFSGNIVKAERLDNVPAPYSGAIVTHGLFRKPDSLPVVYRDSTLISNYVIVQFGEAYARGNNHHFENVRFVRIGNDPDFATFRFGGQYHSTGHLIRDGIFEGGAASDDVHWERTGKSSYAVQWTLDLTADPGAEVRVEDAQGAVAFTGAVGDNGLLRIPLTQSLIVPGDAPRTSRVTTLTPHSLTVSLGDRKATHSVDMTQRRALNVRAN